MDFELTPQQKLIQKTMRKFAEENIDPIAAEIDATDRFPEELFRKMGKLGIFSTPYPRKFGGAEAGYVAWALTLAEIGRASASVGLITNVQGCLSTQPIFVGGANEQKHKFLTPMISGEKIGAFGLTEPSAGSDIFSMNGTARLDGDEYVLNCNKCYITLGNIADHLVVFLKTSPDRGSKSLSAFVVERGTPGWVKGNEEQKLGMHGTVTSEFFLDNCRVPAENLLGKEGDGAMIVFNTLGSGRITISGLTLGIGMACLEKSIEYAKQREQFGRPIASFQAIQWKLADMATDLLAARFLILNAAFLKDQGKDFNQAASMAKLFVTQAVQRAVNEAIQIHGGYGYMKDYPVERYFRDAKLTEIGEGTTEVQRLVIAKKLLQ